MNDSSFKKIDNVLKDYLESNLLVNKKISSKLLIADKWNQIFEALSADVKFLDFKNEQVLFIEVSNSSILYSISINKSKIINSIKELTGIKIIDIKVLVK
ncbi:DciA family protein [Borreliella tanukii]|uniref:DciA family protein n=1 Tax=Borreliella tanukii TaxID=56146 RepID=UPI00264A4681|nr:DciA family protein [Borreliella tanukii]WKC80746.1 DciA family protein [Borreliella tanukii]WKC81662.1 DciA family protein [Borreliella tanukii]